MTNKQPSFKQNLDAFIAETVSALTTELNQNGGHTSDAVERSLEVLEDYATAEVITDANRDRINQIALQVNGREYKAWLAGNSESRLANLNGLAYDTDAGDLACSQYLFDREYPIDEPSFAVDTSNRHTEESSHRHYRWWFEVDLGLATNR